ncbi:unnamed protein product [Blepharisma stoltei]|uniref:Uncharacterized protein n=1 Tax=Blepharisma stoltei TaxID=1481888 RepID=A0AAU9JKA2_9CILI|nr:unnamed protein product [Blepharisma stoltei]
MLENISKDYFLGEVQNFKISTKSIETKLEGTLLNESHEQLKFICDSNQNVAIAYNTYLSSRERIYQKLNFLNEKLDLSSKYLYVNFQVDNKVCLFYYDIDTHQLKQASPEPYRSLCTIQLPNSELFCYGTWDRTSGACAIIDLNTLSLKRILPSGPQALWAGGAYYNNSVYIFSSSYRTLGLDFVNRFDLRKNHWTRLSQLPKSSFGCSIVPFNGKLLVCGFSLNKIYKLDLDIESYSEIPEVLVKECRMKLLSAGYSRAYLFEVGGKIAESEWEDDFKWHKIGMFATTGDYRYGYAKHCNGAVYNILYDLRDTWCYKFDLNKQKLEEIEIKRQYTTNRIFKID